MSLAEIETAQKSIGMEIVAKGQWVAREAMEKHQK